MPLAKFICPHCEKPGEVQVTAVTRSRACPHCGEQVMLQVSEKTAKGKRKALLVGGKGDGVVPSRPDTPSSLPLPKSPAVEARSATVNSETITPPARTLDAEPEVAASLPSFQPQLPVAQASLPISISGPAYEPQSLEGEAFERMKMDPEIVATRRRFLLGALSTIAVCVMAALAHWFWPAPEPKPVVRYSPPEETVVDSPLRLPPNAIGLKNGKAAADTPGEAPPSITFDTASLDLGARKSQPPPPTKPIQLQLNKK
jgi:DNA-directed RNA polymerase subunit RPC12/RpoP